MNLWIRFKIATGARLAIDPKGSGDDIYLWSFQIMPKNYRWF